MKIQIKVTIKNVDTNAFSNDLLFNFNVKRQHGKSIGKQLREAKEKAMGMALDKSALSKYNNWSFRPYITHNPYLDV